jgi:ABC-type transport system involved in multi-copper enzyme maturation permease subunit
MTSLRLFLRANRFELAGVILLAIGVLVVSGGLVARLAGAAIPQACWTHGPGTADCLISKLDLDAYLNDANVWGYFALGGIAGLPILGGLLVGVVLVGKELDRGTAMFSWSLTPSRRRWLLGRVLPAAVFVAVASLAAGVFADWLEVLRNPGSDPYETFSHITTRGGVVGAQAIAFLGISALAGSAIGRILPALLVSAVIVIFTYAGVSIAADAMMEHETITIVDPQAAVPGRLMDVLYRTPDGQLGTWEDLQQRYGAEWETSEDGGQSLGIRQVVVVIPAQLYPIAVARMSILFTVIGLTGLVLTAAVVDRRRP